MAEAFLNHLAKGQFIASSAGTKPASRVDPTVAKAMLEVGIDIRDKKPKLLTFEMIETADRVVTMGCVAGEVCPASFVPTEDWELTDPKGKQIAQVRQIRAEIEGRVNALVKRLL
jgi:arsenate reductase